MKRILWLIGFLLLTFPIHAFAGPVTDARDLALGGFAAADVNLGSAVFVNPAVLSQSDSIKTSFTQTRLSVDNFDFEVSGSFPIAKGIGVGVGWDALAVQNQQEYGIVRDSNGQVVVDPVTGLPQTQVLGFFTQSNNTFYASAAIQAGFYSIGASLKYYLSDFGGTEGTGWGLDLAGQFALTPDCLLAMVLYDPGDSFIHFNDGTPVQTIPSQWLASLSWKIWHNHEFAVRLEPGVQKDIWDDGNSQWGGGVEGSWLDNVFLRAGCNQNQLSFGVGLVAHPEKIFKEIRADYAYLTQAADGFPSRLTLTVEW